MSYLESQISCCVLPIQHVRAAKWDFDARNGPQIFISTKINFFGKSILCQNIVENTSMMALKTFESKF